MRDSIGFCVWLTGLSGSGKSTVAAALTMLLTERDRYVTVLDGDIVRALWPEGLGFSKCDRNLNVRRIGYVAAEVVSHGGAVVCATVSPYRAGRDECRSMIRVGRFVEVFVDTPFEVCKERDGKGLYDRARLGELKDLSGVDAPYEPPRKPEITLNQPWLPATDNAKHILSYLIAHGLVPRGPAGQC